ncbi:MAG: NAD(P)-dependent oxidoreductase [Barnesiella sp.]
MNLLLTGAYSFTPGQIESFQALGYKTLFVQDERVPLEIDTSTVDCVVCNNLFLYNKIEDFKSLKFIQLTSAGLDRVPLDYIKSHEIDLHNARGVYSIPMAEWALLKILEIYKDSLHFMQAQNNRKWLKERNIMELSGRTASVVGMGSVGKEVARRLKAFGVKVLGIDIFEIKEDYVDRFFHINDIDKALSLSDIIVLTLPLTGQTRYLINKERLNSMRQDAVIINISRGAVIQETALIDALNTGKFRGVALDVFEQEPLESNSPLWSMKNVFISPHNSFISDKNNERLFRLMYDNLKNYIS